MKLHFEPHLDYQLQAIAAVCDLFRGQELCRTEFTVARGVSAAQTLLGFARSDSCVGNSLALPDDHLLKNLCQIQLRHGLLPSEALASRDFTVEMETGTGKTYVYLRTLFELHKRYGFTKFIIVVPSVAIREGVYKSLQITEDHFKGLYAGVPFDYFLYDSAKLGKVRNFATSPHIQVMVLTAGAINKKDVNNLYKDSEKIGGEKPIDLIGATRPIVIVDEPQSVDGGLSGAGKAALDAMNPLCTLRYSATHQDKHHMVYRLDAVDAYERKLVKQIEVAAATVEDAHNGPHVRILRVERRRGSLTARVELDVNTESGVRRREVTVRDGDDLAQIAKRPIYADCRIGEIRVAKGNEYVELRVPGGERYLRPGQAWGDAGALTVPREMIRRTIHEHLAKERRLRALRIKVLSLLFVDEVAKYRRYAADGAIEKGEYARIFEEEYRRAARLPEHHSLFRDVDLSRAAEEAHDGYFSIDRKGLWTDTDENNQGNRESAERAYSLIMKDKERLLAFDTPLRFIFSHSALKEGWDNPNVFQICTLRDIRSERERRQTIGRGLRLCVNQDGERVRGSDVNTLTVIAMESFEEFAANLQKEIEEDTGIAFGIVAEHSFAAIRVGGADGSFRPLGLERSRELWEALVAAGYIGSRGRVQDSLREALRDGTLQVPPEFRALLDPISSILRKHAGRLDIRNADDRSRLRPQQPLLPGAEFRALWDKVRHWTTYRVAFDNAKLIESCTRALKDAPPLPRTRLQWRRADIAIGKAGVGAAVRAGAATVLLDAGEIELPDLLAQLQDRTQLTRRTLQRVLSDSGRLDDFRRNPQQFIERAVEAIDRCKRLALADGIRYQRLGGEQSYAQELFEIAELTGDLRNLVGAQECVHERVGCDSDSESTVAGPLEKRAAIRVYAKLPAWFTVPTPLGGYHPDWAVLVERDGGERLYFVFGDRSSALLDALRNREWARASCEAAHFDALPAGEAPATPVQVHSFDDALQRAGDPNAGA